MCCKDLRLNACLTETYDFGLYRAHNPEVVGKTDKRQAPPSTMSFRLLLITRSVCSDMFCTYVLAIFTSAWPSSFWTANGSPEFAAIVAAVLLRV